MNDKPTEIEPAALREMAANRGFRLVRSRRRKPGGDFGRYGLADAKTGKQLFGFGKAGLEASAEEIEEHLRGRSESTWQGSLRAAGKSASARPPRPAAESKPAPARPQRARAAEPVERPVKARPKRDPVSKAPPPPSPPPTLRIRTADSVDGDSVAALVRELGFEIASDDAAERIGRLSRAGEAVLIAKLGDDVVGCLTWHVMPVLHRPLPVGRISMLVVARAARRKGVGKALVAAAEERLSRRGCGLVEVTSNLKLSAAHKFYRSLGYEKTSYRFARPLK